MSAWTVDPGTAYVPNEVGDDDSHASSLIHAKLAGAVESRPQSRREDGKNKTYEEHEQSRER